MAYVGPWSSVGRCRRGTVGGIGRAVIDGLTQSFAGLEVGNPLGGNGNGLTAARIATHPGRAGVGRETAKTTNFDTVPANQGFAHGIQNGFDSVFCITVRDVTKAGRKLFNEV